MKIFLDKKPTLDGSAHRGVGAYTRFLAESLSEIEGVELLDSPLEAQVVHYPYFDLFYHTLPLRHLRPIVVTVHDVIPLLFPKQYLRGFKGSYRLLQQKFSLKRAAAVITDSQSSKRDIIKYLGVSEKKLQVIELAANSMLSRQDLSDSERQELGVPQKYFLYVGDINYNKNIPQLIKALKFLPPDLHLVCAGRNFIKQPIKEWRMIENQSALSDVEQRVHFFTEFGKKPDLALSKLYSGAVCYVQPSLYEGFGLPVLEAMRCQTPVVSTHNSSLIEVGSHYVEYAKTPEALDIANAMKVVLGWSSLKRKHRVAAAVKWEKSFTWGKVASQTLEVYRRVLEKNNKEKIK